MWLVKLVHIISMSYQQMENHSTSWDIPSWTVMKPKASEIESLVKKYIGTTNHWKYKYATKNIFKILYNNENALV